MMINEKKTKSIIFNFTDKYQFGTRLHLNDEIIEVLDSSKLFGTIIASDLRLDLSTMSIIKKANARMELVGRVAGFGASEEDLKIIYFLFVRSILEQSAPVWHSSLTEEHSDDLERVQKSAVKIILRTKYLGYEKSLAKLEMIILKERREQLCLSFAGKCVKNPKTQNMFPENKKMHSMEPRNPEHYMVMKANTDRFKIPRNQQSFICRTYSMKTTWAVLPPIVCIVSLKNKLVSLSLTILPL